MSENASNATRDSLTGNDTESVDAFEASVGDISSPDGRTTLRVEREGQFVVVHEWVETRASESSDTADQRGKDQVPEGDEEQQREENRGDVRELGVEPARLFAAVRALPSNDDFPNRPGLPDEPILTLTIESASGGGRIERMWLRDAERQLEQLVGPMRTIVERATDGRRYL